MIRVTNIRNAPWAGGQWRIEPGQTIEVPFDFLASFGPNPMLDFDLSGAEENLALRDSEGRLTFDFWCPLSSVDGYGRHALDIYRGLVELGAAPILRDAGWGNDHKPRDLAQLAEANKRKLPSRIGMVMSVPYDEGLTSHSSVYKVVITQFETDHVPDFHVKAVNKADHFITTSKFQPDVWRRSGLRKSLAVTVLTPGVDTGYFAYKPRERDGLFKVLMLGALTGRKDPVSAIRIFQEASKGDPNWRFTIKTRNASGLHNVLGAMGIHAEVKSRQGMGPDELRIDGTPLTMPFRMTARNDARVEIVIADDSPDDVRNYYWGHDCLLWPSKGEGVGLPPLEAMSCGLEVVMSTNSGMADYAFPSHCWPIKGAGTEPADGPNGFSDDYIRAFGQVGSWWTISIDDAISQLRRAHNAWQMGTGKGERAANYVRSNHTLKLQAGSVLKVLETFA